MLPVTYHLLLRTRAASEIWEDEMEDGDGEEESEEVRVKETRASGQEDALDALEPPLKRNDGIKSLRASTNARAVLRKRHQGNRGALQFGHLAVLAGALKEALGARVVINCLDARHLGTVWGYRKSSQEYLVKLDNAVGNLGEAIEAGEVFSPFPCDHVMILDSSIDLHVAEEVHFQGTGKRSLSADESKTVYELSPWQVVLAEKTPQNHALCAMSELVEGNDTLQNEDFLKPTTTDMQDKYCEILW